jgi:putative transposase
VLDVSSSAYYEWETEQVSQREIRDTELTLTIQEIYDDQRGNYGAPRIHDALAKRGKRTSRKRVARLMKKAELRAKTAKKFKVTTDSAHDLPVALNYLDRNFNAPHPNRAWVGDITYLWTREGWLYLATVIDLYSRKVVGWALRDRMTADLVSESLDKAVERRRPTLGLLFHSDRGSQYASHQYRKQLKRFGMVQSMSRKGNCWDNAVAESFFATLKKELVRDTAWPSKAEARAEIFEYIESYYNRKRGHSAIGYVSPETFESCEKPRLAA